MYFTREDIEKISKELLASGIKDSELPECILPISKEDTISIIQNNQNKQISIKEFNKEMVSLFGLDFINLTDRYSVEYVSLEEAIASIPQNQRKRGLVITFYNQEKQWKIYQFIGEQNQFNNPTLWKDLFNIDLYTIKSQLPDGEDITSTDPDFMGNSKLKLKDRLYDPYNFSGKGTKIVRKNIRDIILEDGKIKRVNYLSPDTFVHENTIYIIRYDFDLNGQTIIVPEGSILKYEGGSITNGNIIYNRPSNVNIGFMFFDESLNKPIWWNGNNWVDSQGMNV